MQRTEMEEQLERPRGDGGELSVERLRMGDEWLPRTRDGHEKGKGKTRTCKNESENGRQKLGSLKQLRGHVPELDALVNRNPKTPYCKVGEDRSTSTDRPSGEEHKMISNDEWKRIAFPFDPKIVYVVKIRKEGEFRPIYVGMSKTRNIGRIGDYVSCRFTASVDFKVGVAARHLSSKGYEVVIDYRLSGNPRDEEKKLVDDFKKDGLVLLNGRFGYNYKTEQIEEIRDLITAFVDVHF